LRRLSPWAEAAYSIWSLLTLDARTSYPWPLCWGNALWGYAAYRKNRASQPAALQPGWLFSLIASFVLYTMPANIFTNLLGFGRTPSALVSTLILPVHIVCCFALEWCPADALFRVLGATVPFIIIDSLGVLDNVTTAMNYMEEALTLFGSPVIAILCGMIVNLAGQVVRHFVANGFAEGAARFDACLRANVLYSFWATSMYMFAIHRCSGAEQCVAGTHLYEVLPWLAVARNLRGYLAPAQPPSKDKSA